MSYNHQSGQQLVIAYKASINDLHIDAIECGYQQACKWRRRVLTDRAHLVDCERSTLFRHFDDIERAATAWRGQVMALSGRVTQMAKELKDAQSRVRGLKQAIADRKANGNV